MLQAGARTACRQTARPATTRCHSLVATTGRPRELVRHGGEERVGRRPVLAHVYQLHVRGPVLAHVYQLHVRGRVLAHVHQLHVAIAVAKAAADRLVERSTPPPCSLTSTRTAARRHCRAGERRSNRARGGTTVAQDTGGRPMNEWRAPHAVGSAAGGWPASERPRETRRAWGGGGGGGAHPHPRPPPPPRPRGAARGGGGRPAPPPRLTPTPAAPPPAAAGATAARPATPAAGRRRPR